MDTIVSIVSPRAFLTDIDIDATITSITVELTNPQLPLGEEFLSVTEDPSPVLQVSDRNSTTSIVIEAPDPTLASTTDFITVLLSIRYNNLADEPVGDMRVIEFTVFDGVNVNDPKTITTINIQTVNDIPVNDLNGPDEEGENGFAQYIEGSPALFIAQNLFITEPDNEQLTHAMMSFEQVYDEGNETIAINEDFLPVGVVCVPSCNGTSINLIGPADRSEYENVLRTLSYINLQQPQDLPNLRDRVIFVQVSDGESFSNPETHILIDFISLNPRVIVQLDVPNQNYSTTFTEGQTVPISVTGLVRIVDTSLDTLESVVISVRDNLPGGIREEGEAINLANLGTLGDISVEINTVLKRITFSQEAPVSEYVEAITRVRYINTADEPECDTRFVDFLVIPGGGAPNDAAHARIGILHLNDHDPICNPQFQMTTINEDTEPIATIHQFLATDADRCVGGNITYSLASGDTSLFSVTEQGDVQLIGTLDFEGQQSHVIEVNACDDGTPTARCCTFTLTVIVRDINDNPPVFVPSVIDVQIPENTVTTVTTFTITDADSGVNAGVASLEVVSYNPLLGCMGMFATQLSPPTLSTVAPGLDFEVIVSNVCELVVVAEDTGSPSMTGNVTVRVNVTNLDDFPPEFTLDTFEFSIEEDNTFPMVVMPAPGRVTASDRDSDSFTFSLQGTTMFFIDGLTGEISINFATNYDIAMSYSFMAVATDPAGNFDTANVIVNVIPINNDPPVLDLNTTDPTSNDALTPVVFVEESGSPVSIVTMPSITDPDVVTLEITEITARVANSPNRQFEMLSILPSDSFLLLPTVDSAEIRIEPLDVTNISVVFILLRSIRYENTEDEISSCQPDLYPCDYGNESRTILITVFDGEHNSNEAAAYVTFVPVNDAPFLDLDTFVVGTDFTTLFTERLPPVNIINTAGFLITDDDDSTLNGLTCVLVNAQDGGDELLTFNNTFLTVGQSDISVAPHQVSITGIATLAEYATILSSIQYNSVTLNPSLSPARVIQCIVFDPDSRSSNTAVTTVSLLPFNQAAGVDLDSTTLSVNYQTIFTEEDGPVLLSNGARIFDVDSIHMTSLNATLLSASGPEEILSLNEAFLTPSLVYEYSFPTLRVTGLENLTVYEAILGSVTYDNTVEEIAEINDRVVQFIITDDEGDDSFPVNATIGIQFVDDNIPEFVPNSTYTFTVNENAARDFLLGTIEVMDRDLPSTNNVPVFRIDSSNPSFGTSDFTIQNNPVNLLQGQIRVIGDLDYDNKATSYDLVITAASGPFNVTATVHIDVLNIADLPPVFIDFPLEFVVFEETPISTPLNPDRVIAEDQDQLEAIVYSISGNVIEGIELIQINPSTGQLFVQNNIDREAPLREFEITITATDSNAGISNTSTVRVLGINEFPPEFDPLSYQTEIEENAPPSGLPAVTVSATDPDEAPDSVDVGFVSSIVYSILPGDGSQFFSIDSVNGSIFQTGLIDYEEFSVIILRVVANDNDSTPVSLTADVNVIVNIRNLNDESPFFDNITAVSFIVVSELTSPGMMIATIQFDDPDIDANLQIRFNNTPIDPPLFLLNSGSGEISTLRSLDADSGGAKQFEFTVVLTDLNTHPLYVDREFVSGNIIIAIEDRNDLAPSFSQDNYQGYIVENNPPGSTINDLDISATDGDCGVTPLGLPNGNNELRFFLGDDAPSDLFAINEATGVITKLQVLDREEEDEYHFMILVRDTPLFDTENTDTAMVWITVRDVNEHPPVADPSLYYVFVSEDTPADSQLETFASVQWSTTSKCVLIYS